MCQEICKCPIKELSIFVMIYLIKQYLKKKKYNQHLRQELNPRAGFTSSDRKGTYRDSKKVPDDIWVAILINIDLTTTRCTLQTPMTNFYVTLILTSTCSITFATSLLVKKMLVSTFDCLHSAPAFVSNN